MASDNKASKPKPSLDVYKQSFREYLAEGAAGYEAPVPEWQVFPRRNSRESAQADRVVSVGECGVADGLRSCCALQECVNGGFSTEARGCPCIPLGSAGADGPRKH
ncbi:hypothetical protein ON010_g17672 [Phytophthora cinnamomi]|nr:hypothetical protein ON010_g17672 [Phytophthora cinnamomi]